MDTLFLRRIESLSIITLKERDDGTKKQVLETSAY